VQGGLVKERFKKGISELRTKEKEIEQYTNNQFINNKRLLKNKINKIILSE